MACQCRREIGYDAIANNLRGVARGLEGSTKDVQRDKLIVWTDLQLLAKWMPKKYGEKLALDHNITENMAELIKNGRKRVEDETQPNG